MEEINPEVLVISNTHDYSTDHITYNLREAGISYLRLDRDQFSFINITLLPLEEKIYGETNNFTFLISSKRLKSIYFRAPVYLHDIYKPNLTPDEQFSRTQWAAFIRSLITFEKVNWVNNPQATYKAEIKPYQLYLAKKIGFKVPDTLITNSNMILNEHHQSKKKFVIKTLDSTVLKIDNHEAFIYTNIIDYNELKNLKISSAPVILQEALIPKIDIRVTVVDNFILAVNITKNNKGINTDWRKEKNNLKYKKVKLPKDLEMKCIKLVKNLGLKFGAIDLIYHNDKYYFLEINPTGEWAWFLDHINTNIDSKISNFLIEGKI